MSEQIALFAALPRSTPYMELQGARIDDAIRHLKRRAIKPDPMISAARSRIASQVGSVQKRHGHLLEDFIRDAVRCNHDLEVWREPCFQVSTAANGLALDEITAATAKATRLPYEMSGPTTLEIDMLVYNRPARSLRAYEIKRANGPLDRGKTLQTVANLRRVQFLLHSYGEARGLDIATAESWLICFYGVRVRGAPFSVDRHELDNHFGFPVLAMIEEANGLWRDRLEALDAL